MGAPDYRIVAGLSVQPSFDPQDRDSDGDEVPDGSTAASRGRDLDGQDDDGCPELDNDVYDIPDANDDARWIPRMTTVARQRRLRHRQRQGRI